MSPVLSLQQPGRHREHRAEQRARDDQQTRDQHHFSNEQRRPVRSRPCREVIHRVRELREEIEFDRAHSSERELESRETGERDAAAHETRDHGAAEGQSQEIDAEHRRERIDR